MKKPKLELVSRGDAIARIEGTLSRVTQQGGRVRWYIEDITKGLKWLIEDNEEEFTSEEREELAIILEAYEEEIKLTFNAASIAERILKQYQARGAQ